MTTNNQRAAWAQHAVETFRLVSGGDVDQSEAISFLIADLCHLTAQYGQDPLEQVQRGFDHFTYESVMAEDQVTLTYKQFRLLVSELSNGEKSRFRKGIQEFKGQLTRMNIKYNRVTGTWDHVGTEH